jgi:hypothetical protein
MTSHECRSRLWEGRTEVVLGLESWASPQARTPNPLAKGRFRNPRPAEFARLWAARGAGCVCAVLVGSNPVKGRWTGRPGRRRDGIPLRTPCCANCPGGGGRRDNHRRKMVRPNRIQNDQNDIGCGRLNRRLGPHALGLLSANHAKASVMKATTFIACCPANRPGSDVEHDSQRRHVGARGRPSSEPSPNPRRSGEFWRASGSRPYGLVDTDHARKAPTSPINTRRRQQPAEGLTAQSGGAAAEWFLAR